MRHATSLLYHVCAVTSQNIRFASCGTSGKLTLWTCFVFIFTDHLSSINILRFEIKKVFWSTDNRWAYASTDTNIYTEMEFFVYNTSECVIIRNLINAIFYIQWEANFSYWWSHWTCRDLLPSSFLFKVWHTPKDVLDKEYYNNISSQHEESTVF
jgi:hypothetical protein